jgi:hypothetical protein
MTLAFLGGPDALLTLFDIACHSPLFAANQSAPGAAAPSGIASLEGSSPLLSLLTERLPSICSEGNAASVLTHCLTRIGAACQTMALGTAVVESDHPYTLTAWRKPARLDHAAALLVRAFSLMS